MNAKTLVFVICIETLIYFYYINCITVTLITAPFKNPFITIDHAEISYLLLSNHFALLNSQRNYWKTKILFKFLYYEAQINSRGFSSEKKK